MRQGDEQDETDRRSKEDAAGPTRERRAWCVFSHREARGHLSPLSGEWARARARHLTRVSPDEVIVAGDSQRFCRRKSASGRCVSQSPWGPPQIAFDIPKTAIDTLLKNAPPAVDQQLRVVDMGKYNLIPPGVLHAWSKIEDHVTYLSVRPDPDRSLPGGYINPLIMTVKMPDAKP